MVAHIFKYFFQQLQLDLYNHDKLRGDATESLLKNRQHC